MVGLSLNKQKQAQTIGRIVGRFLSDEEILLSPDSNFDRSRQHSGDSLQIVHVPDGKIVQGAETRSIRANRGDQEFRKW